MRWRHCTDHADTKQKPLMRPDCLLGVVPQPADSRLCETNSKIAAAEGQPHSLYLDLRFNCDKRYIVRVLCRIGKHPGRRYMPISCTTTLKSLHWLPVEFWMKYKIHLHVYWPLILHIDMKQNMYRTCWFIEPFMIKITEWPNICDFRPQYKNRSLW